MISDHNALYHCDALAVLERLPSNSITLVYLDPPWPTNDDEALFLSQVAQQIQRVLQNKGSLFFQFPNRPSMDLRLVVNQAFGTIPFYEITWQMPRASFSRSGPRRDSETLLVYSKTDAPIFNTVYRPPLEGEQVRFTLSDQRGHFRHVDLTVPGRSARQEKWRKYELPSGRSWRFSIEMLERLAHEGRIVFPASGGLPKMKQYLDEQQGIEVGTIWTDISITPIKAESLKYPTQKPLRLLERVIQSGSNTGDIILDPFVGSGTTLEAAHKLGRKWIGVDNSPEAQVTTQQRLLNRCGLEKGKDYLHFDVTDVVDHPTKELTYRRVVTSVQEIASLQQDVKQLTDRLLSLKRLMNIGEADSEERVEDAINQMEHWISASITQQRKPLQDYVTQVKSWLALWDRLDKASQTFLSEGELLFENIAESHSEDYSPFILQYCRALENELLTKLFAAFTDSFLTHHPDAEDFLAQDLLNDKTKKFASYLRGGKTNYTLGDMAFIMGLLEAGGKTLGSSALLAEFRKFTLIYFSENIVAKAYLNQIKKINEDFRRKAAHPYVMDIQVAQSCRDLLRQCLNEFILNYHPV